MVRQGETGCPTLTMLSVMLRNPCSSARVQYSDRLTGYVLLYHDLFVPY